MAIAGLRCVRAQGAGPARAPGRGGRAALVALRVEEKKRCPDLGLIALSVPELRRLLSRIVRRTGGSVEHVLHVLHLSNWRRRVSVLPPPWHDVVEETILSTALDQAAGFCQRCGSSSSMRLFRWLGSRSSTSRR